MEVILAPITATPNPYLTPPKLHLSSISNSQSPHTPEINKMSSNGKLNIAVFPWLAFGHMLPFLELSKSLARRGHKISFISTPRNIQRLPKPPPQISHLIDFIPLPLPKTEGLPEGAEATSDLPYETVEYLKKALDGLQQPFAEFIRDSKPDWIVCDFVQHWIPKKADEADIPTVYLSIFMAGLLVYFGPTSDLVYSRNTPEEMAVPPPWIPFPSKLCYRMYEARKLYAYSVEPNKSGLSDIERYMIAVEGCKVLAVRSCMEFESEWLQLLPEIINKPVLPVGLLPPAAAFDGGRGGNEEGPNIIEWLDNQSSRSVVYIAFGSEAALNLEQMHELAYGVELAGLPFVWVFRGKDELLPTGFEERTGKYGIVARCWVPQLEILAHESIGGFLTHSGWSSVIESLQFGHPLVLLPIFADQGINTRVIMEKGIAVEIERNEDDGYFTKEAVAKALKLAVVDEEGECYRKKAKELTIIFTDQDRQDKYVDDFIEHLRDYKIEDHKA